MNTDTVEIIIGGDTVFNNIPIRDVLGNTPKIFNIDTRKPNNIRGVWKDGNAWLFTSLSYLYSLISAQPVNSQYQYAAAWTSIYAEQLSPVLFSKPEDAFTIWRDETGTKIEAIIPNFEYYVINEKSFDLTAELRKSWNLPKFVTSETSGYIQFTPEFNIPTTFDNANFERAEDDNYTNHIEEFINSPQFDLSLHIRPKIYKQCSKQHCKKCWKKHTKQLKKQNFTTAPILKYFVIYVYQTCLDIQKNRISFNDGKQQILEKVKFFDKYGSNSSIMFNIYLDPNNFINMYFCKRYNLKQKDCIVGFTLQGINDFVDKDQNIYDQVILGASSVPIDEDMSDAVWPSNTGIFVYNKTV